MIHCYKLGGLNIVLDIYSGSVHVVDEVAYDIIEAYESADKDILKSEIIAKHGITADEFDFNLVCHLGRLGVLVI